ncbi:MAG: OmpA family protein [Gammaproteobacteria bacterium]|nr:OmpA family protein [Gammaproteobacteria bacterium]
MINRNQVIQVTITLLALMLTACTGNNIVKQEPKVKQLHNLGDYDSDGVIKARDNCEQTIIGSTITNDGCGTVRPIAENLQLNVQFENASASVDFSFYDKIATVAQFLNKYPQSSVLIEGHTSQIGGQVFNQKLSEQRANAIANVLVDNYNIESDRISTVGHGFEQRINLGESAIAHAENRRIMAELTGHSEVADMIWTIYTVDSE